MAIQKITADVISSDAITTASISDSAITAAKLAGTLDLTGKTITVATASAGDNDTSPASTAFVQQEISALVDSSPDALNTLNELAAALGDDANFSTTVTNSIATKLPLAGGALTGNLSIGDSSSRSFALYIENAGSAGAGQLMLVDSDNDTLQREIRTDAGVLSFDYWDSSNRSNHLTILANGNVGIGTTNPLAPLTISNNGAEGFEFGPGVTNFGVANTNYIASYDRSASTYRDISFDMGGVESSSIRFKAGGNVGIGTSSPQEKLEVNGVLQIKRDGDHPALRFQEINSGTTTTRGYIASGDWAINGGAIDDFGISGSATGDLLLATNAGVERLRIQNSTGNVGIGETDPETSLHIKNAGNSFLTLERSGTTGGTGKFGINMEGGSSQQTTMAYDDGGKLVIGRSSDPATQAGFSNDFVLDSLGNVLVGKTSADNTTAGTRIHPAGYASFTIANDYPIIANRLSSDGDIAVFRKDGTTVGSIGANSGDIYIASTGTYSAGLMFEGSSGAQDIRPCSSTGALLDGAVDLGDSSARFKNLYFSGGLYGGTEVQTDTVGVGAVASGGSVARNTSENDGIFWHTSKNDYAIYRTTGAWSGPNYQQLKLDWDTGIFIDGGTSYGKSGVHISEKVSLGDSSYSNFGSPNYQVHIVGDNQSLAIESGTGEAYLGSQNTSYFHITGNRTFYFGNRCEASGGFHTYSDERLKENITPISDALDKVSQMNGITFSWIDAENRGGGDTGKQFGVTAQNMLEVDSELPTLNKDPLASQDEIDNEESTDYYSMDYSRITPFLIEAVKELKTKLEAAEARITELEG